MGKRTVAGLLGLLLLAGGARAQAYRLAEEALADSYFQIELDMTLEGEIKVQQEGKLVPMKQTANARHRFLERILEADKAGQAARSARIYQSARAEIGNGQERSERTFRNDRSFQVAQRIKDQVFVYCPNGLMTREELELTEHFDTLGLPGLLPGREVKVSETWKVANAAAQTLLDLDGLISQDLTCKLDRVEDGLAQVSISGTGNGIDLGAAVKMSITATYQFDLKAKRLLALEWKQSDQRDQGPVTPAFTAQVLTKVKRTPIEPVSELNDLFLTGKVPPTPPESLTRLIYKDRGYELVHGRDWHLVAQSERQTVMRLMDQGEFLAQVTITPWKKAEPGKHLAEEEFKEAMAQAPGWEQEDMPDKGTVLDDPVNKYWIYRIAASGTLNGVKAVQYFYLLAGPQGDQVVLAFTMAPAQAQKLNTRDLDLVRGFKLAEARQATSLPE